MTIRDQSRQVNAVLSRIERFCAGRGGPVVSRAQVEATAYCAFLEHDANDLQSVEWLEARDAGDEAGMARAAEVLDRQGAGARAIAEAWGF